MTQPQTEMVEKILRCPFCGGDNIGAFENMGERTIHGICHDCGCEGPGAKVGERPVEKWNARTIAPDIEELVGALRAAKGYALNAKIDLQTGATKTTAIRTIDGGIAKIDAALSKFTNTKGNDRG